MSLARVYDLVVSTPIASGTSGQGFDLGVRGLVTHLRIYASSLTGLTNVFGNFNNSASGPNELSNLTAGQFSQDLSSDTYTGAGNANYYSDSRELFLIANGSQIAGQFLVVEGEVLVSPSTAEASTDQLVGSGAPSASASYFGQRYWDSTNNKMYFAKAVGSGSSDWTQL